jgi:hypothetical protein
MESLVNPYRPLAAAVLALALTGCSGTSSPTAEAPAPAPAATTTAAAMTAVEVIEKLEAADLGLSKVAAQDEDTDPNNLVGRPNGYLSRASADLPGGDKQGEKYGIDRGLVVETFPSANDASLRSGYIQGALKGAQLLGTEWHYMADDGRALVRVSGKVKPSLAKKIEAAVADL